MKNRFLILLILVAIPNISQATPDTYWLTTNTQVDGSIQTQNTVILSTDFQATATSLETLIYAGDTTSAFVINGLAYLLTNHDNSTEQLVRIIQIQAQVNSVDQLLLDELLNRINPDGGIGENLGFSSNVLDSTWTLLAFASIDSIDAQVISLLIAYINNKEQTDHGYTHYQSNESSIYVSSLVSLAFNKYKTTFNSLLSEIQSINQFIISKQLVNGGWSETHENALAIISLAKSNYDVSAYWVSVLQLRGVQSGISNWNIHWDEEVYTTALALIANDLTIHMTEPSNYGSITAKVVDSLSNQVIYGAQVSMDNGAKTDTTDSLGVFHISNISNGNHDLDISFVGYLSENINFDIQSGENKNLGIISLIKTPTTGLIKGVMKNGNSGVPIYNAQIEVVADTNYTTTTDSLGRFQLEIQPGNFTLTATKHQYNALQATSTIAGGEIIDFNLSAYPIGVVVDEAEIIGRLISNDTNAPIAGATINVNNTDYSSNANGEFQITSLPIGQTSILVTSSGYQSLSISAYLTGGTTDFGDIALLANTSTNSTIHGVVKSNVTNQGLANVQVSITDTNLSALSHQDGSYQITDITNTNYNVQFSFPTYETITYQVSSQQHATTELNLTLTKINSSPISVIEFLPERFEYKGAQEVELDIELLNDSNQDVKTRLYISVKNSNGDIISYYPIKKIPSNGNIDDALDNLLANQLYAVKTNWSTRFMDPDTYIIDLLAYAENGADLLAQGSTSIEVLSAKVVSGKVSFSPENTNFDPNQQIDIKANIYSSGNQAIGNLDVTANVYLVDKKDITNDLALTLVDQYTDPLLTRPYHIQKNSTGELLIYNLSHNGTIVKLKSDETFEHFLNVGNIEDFAVNATNQIFTIDYWCTFKKYDSDGTLLNSLSTGISDCRKVKLLNDGTLHFVSEDSGIYNYNPTTGVVEHLVGNYFQQPQGVLKHSDGRILIADGTSNSILSFSNDELTTWINGLSNPHGMCEDIDGTILVANYGSNEILRIDTNGITTVVNNTIQKPYDIKINTNGGYYVSSEQDNTVYQLNSNGTTTVLYQSFIKKPAVIVAGNNSDEYIYNSLDKSIVHRLSDGTTSVVLNAVNVVNAMTVDVNDRLIIAMIDNVYRLESNSSLTALSAANINVKRIESTNSVTEFLVYLTNGKIQKLDTVTQSLLDYIQTPFNNIISTQADSTGLIYILDNTGAITTLDQNMEYQIVKTGLGLPLDMFISTNDEIYISRNDKTIIKLDSSYAITQTTTVNNIPNNFVIKNNGDILYSDNTSTIYKNDGVQESNYVTASGNITGDIGITNSGELIVTFQSYTFDRIATDLTVTNIHSGLYRLNSISVDGSGGAWISYNGGVFHIDSNNSILTTHSSPQAPYYANIVVLNNGFILAHDSVIHKFDLSFDFLKKYSGFSGIYDFGKLSNNDVIISAPYKLIRYTSPTKLAELLKTDRYYHIEEKDNTHLFVSTYNKLLELDLTTGNTIDLYDITNDGDFAVVNNTIHLVEKLKNKYTELDFTGVEQFKQFGLVALQGLTVDENNTLYFNDYYGVYKYSSLNNSEKIEGLEGVGYMVYNSGVIYKTNTHGNEMMVKDLISGNVVRYNTGYFSSLAYLSDNELFLASTYGLKKYKINGEITYLLSNANKVTDIVQKNDGRIYLMNGSSSGGIFELTGNILSQYKNKSELFNTYSYSLGHENGFLYINDTTSIIQIGDSTIRKITTPIKLAFIRDAIEVIGSTIYAVDGAKLYKLEMHDPLNNFPSIGDLVHSSTVNVNLDVNELEVNFTSFNAPIAGDYSVSLELPDSEILSDINDSIHVGNVATGQIQISSTSTRPGDIVLQTSTSIDGVDIDTFVSINPDEIQEINTGGVTDFYRSMIDSNGNIYYLAGNQDIIHRIDFITKVDTIILNTIESVSRILRDNLGDIVLLGKYTKAWWIDTDGIVTKTLDFGAITGNTRITFGDFDADNNLIIHKKSGDEFPIYKINHMTNTSTIVHPNIPTSHNNLRVSGNGDIFMIGRGVNVYNPTDQTLTKIRETISGEGEYGNNAVVVCENTQLHTEPLIGEEDALYAGTRKDLVLDKIVFDIDGVEYDKITSNLLLHDEGTSGVPYRLLNLPVHCGKMYVELHLTDQANTSLNSFDIAPDQTIEVGLNTHEYIWKIDELDTVQKLFNFQTQVDNLLPNESRQILSSAYLKFKNSLNPQQDLIVNLDVPNIQGVIDRSINVILDDTQYQGNTDVNITNTIENTASSAFNGFVIQSIKDANGHLVHSFPQVDVTNLSATSQQDINVVFNTLNYYAGDYTLVTKLYDGTGNIQDEKSNAFTIIASEVNQSLVELNVLTDKFHYSDTSTVQISPSVTNLSNNNIIQGHNAQLLVSNPDSIIVFQQTIAVDNLTAQALQSWSNNFNLNKAKVGTYIVSVNLLDTNNTIVANETTTFNVVLDEQLSLSGSVLVTNEQIQPPNNNSCHYELTNTASVAINNIEIHQTVVNLSNQLTMQDDIVTIGLTSGETWSNDQSISTSQLSSGDHACILRTIINAEDTTQASSIFFVQGANQISGILWNDSNGNGVLDNTEAGIENIEVKLLDASQLLLQTQLTNNMGNYQFDPISNGDYMIEIIETGVLNNYLITFGTTPNSLNINNHHQTINFGYQAQIGSTSGIIWNDENANQIIDTGEGFYPDITIDLLDLSNNIIANTHSDADGIFAFLDQSIGQYRLTVTDDLGSLTGLNNTTNSTQAIDILGSPQVSDSFFGFRQDIFDLTVNSSSCLIGINENSPIHMAISIQNKGNTDISQAIITNSITAGLANITWTCEAFGAATCTPSGNNMINDSIDMPQGSSILYRINGDITAQLQDTITNSYSITMPASITDDFPLNNNGEKTYIVLFDQDIGKLFIDSFECIEATTTKQLKKNKQTNTIKLINPIPITPFETPYWIAVAGEPR